MLFRPKQVVCVCIGMRMTSECWKLGVVVKDASSRANVLYKVAVPIQESTGWGNGPHERNGSYEWCGEILLPDDPLALLFARVSSRSFLKLFVESQVLSRRAQYTVAPQQLCVADPGVLWKKIFQQT